jgi:hypothetical protein
LLLSLADFRAPDLLFILRRSVTRRNGEVKQKLVHSSVDARLNFVLDMGNGLP